MLISEMHSDAGCEQKSMEKVNMDLPALVFPLPLIYSNIGLPYLCACTRKLNDGVYWLLWLLTLLWKRPMWPPLALYDSGIWCRDGKASDLTRHTQPGGFWCTEEGGKEGEKSRISNLCGKGDSITLTYISQQSLISSPRATRFKPCLLSMTKTSTDWDVSNGNRSLTHFVNVNHQTHQP